MAWTPELLHGLCINGCAEISESGRARLAAAKENAVPLSLLWNNRGDQPVIRWDRELLDWIEDRADLLDAIRKTGKSVYFWDAFTALPARDRVSEILAWNQGSIPSCCLTATSHAIQAATLIAAQLGAPVRYDAVNPIYAHYVSLGGVMSRGQDCFSAGEFVNEKGVYPVSAVGANNLSTPSDYRKYEAVARENRVAIAFVPEIDTDTVFLLARAGLPFVFGSAQFCTAAEKDRNGIAVGRAWTSGAHAEMGAAGYVEAGGTEYAYVQNSHGDGYERDGTGHTPSGYWLTRDGWNRLTSTMARYGDPFVVFPRAEISDRLTFVPLGLDRKERRA